MIVKCGQTVVNPWSNIVNRIAYYALTLVTLGTLNLCGQE